MTLNQLRYVVTVATSSSITEAAGKLYLTQPSLTSSIRALEKELGITIFSRTNKGANLTLEGEEFLGYARQVLEQMNLLEERYTGTGTRRRFCISAQHYAFVVEAFVKFLREYGGEDYEFHIRETETYQIIEDVALLRSDLGILYRNAFNETILNRTFSEHNLEFIPLFRARIHVFLGDSHPLADRESLTLEELAAYPRLTYEQGNHNSFYFAEEPISTMDSRQDIVVTDRATLFNLLVGMNGYTLSSGIVDPKLNGDHIASIPLAGAGGGSDDGYMEIGYLKRRNSELSKYARLFLDAMRENLNIQGF